MLPRGIRVVINWLWVLIIKSAHAGAPAAEEDWLSVAWLPEQRNSSLFLSVPEISWLCLPVTLFFPPPFFFFKKIIIILVRAGPQVPSVAVYSTEDKQSEWRDSWRNRASLNVAVLLQTNSAHSVWPQRCSAWRPTRRWTRPTAACRCPKWRTRPSSSTTTVRARTHLQLSPQSGGVPRFLWLLLCVTALTMQILKPAGFVDTAHYPLLLLVWVWIHGACPKSMRRFNSQI